MPGKISLSKSAIIESKVSDLAGGPLDSVAATWPGTVWARTE